MTDKRIVLTTTGSKTEAQEIGWALVERKLAACVNVVGPVQSVYRWKGAVEAAEEFLCIVKTTATALDKVTAAIKELHSYELPECVVVPVEAGSEDYLRWIGENVS
ncbi:MAG TPA: divalent-cation tolerance protein CutA [Terriglobales bacterium]|nr:divalent-cation tolerance protein CutA [Terriglobales bacterium]